jgi:hypothetical protein
VTWMPDGLRILPAGELPALPNSAIHLLKSRNAVQPVSGEVDRGGGHSEV